MRARVVTQRGSFAEKYYAIAIQVDGIDHKWSENNEFILRTSVGDYPCGDNDDDRTAEGLNEKAREFMQRIVDQINGFNCPHHWNNGGNCAP